MLGRHEAQLQTNMHQVLHALLNSAKLWAPSEILTRPSPVPAEPGLYAWYFCEVPPGVPTDGCVMREGATLLYLGISKQSLRTRLRSHLRGNACGSTLRLSLGCLLANHLDLELRHAGNGDDTTFGPGEAVLSKWLCEHARITWRPSPEPWKNESDFIATMPLPLNLKHNQCHPFFPTLSKLRGEAKRRAASLAPW